MKGLPLPYDLEGAFNLGIFSNNSFSSGWIHRNNFKGSYFFVNNNNNNNNNNCRGSSGDTESTSVLDTLRIQSPPTSTSTLSSSIGGGNTLGGGGRGRAASTDTTGVATVYGNSSSKWHPDAASATSSYIAVDPKFQAAPTSFPMGVASITTTGILAGEECSLEEWDSVLPESVAASPNQEQNILKWIMGDVDDPSMANLNKVLQSGGGQAAGYDFNSGFGVADQGFVGDDSVGQGKNPNLMPNVNPKMGFLATSSGDIAFNQEHQQLMQPFDSDPMRPPFYSPQVLVNQQQTEQPQNPTFFMPMPYGDQAENMAMPLQAKRHNPGPVGDPKAQILETGPIPFMGRQAHLQQQQVMPPYQLQLLPGFLQQRPNNAMKPKMVGEDAGQHQQQVIIDQLYKAMDFVQTGNPLLAQTILARLNQQLSPIGKPFYRSAFYFKEALQLLLNTNTLQDPYSSSLPPSSLIFKIGAYKSFSEVSPVVQFANFTCNQALLEVLQGFDRIHIIDFDIGYGGQWASFIQELSLRNGGPPSLKITAFSSPSFHDQLELGFTKENLNHFASETNLDFEFEIVSIESISSSLSWSLPFHISENVAIGVNLPLSSFTNFHLSMPMVLHFIKQLSPKIVVSLERGWDRTDLPFPNHVIHALQSYSNLLESVDAVNVNSDSLQKIERFLIQPGIEKMLLSRYRSPDKTQQHWKALFMSSGFAPLNFSNFTESLAECVVKRTPVRGFHVEKRQSSFVLCWQRKELISASAWRC